MSEYAFNPLTGRLDRTGSAQDIGALVSLTGNDGLPVAGTLGNVTVVTDNSSPQFLNDGGALTLDFGISNLSLGSSLPNLTTGLNNVSYGLGSLALIISGSNNSAIGNSSLASLLTGNFNAAFGSSSGSAYVNAESSNITILNSGSAAESNTTRIGTQGTGLGQQNRFFAAGIVGATVAGQLANISSLGQVGQLASGTTGQFLQSAGVGLSPIWSTTTLPTTSGAIGTFLRSNGTNLVNSTATIPDTYVQGDIIYASATNVLTALAKNVTATRYLSNTGTSNAPAWAQVNAANGLTGITPIANGGTNASSFATTNGIAKYDGTRLVTSTATIDASNRYINPSQPASSGYVFSSLTDVTGDGTEYIVNYGQAPYNQTGNLTLAGTFTCPIAGFYAVNLQVTLAELLAGHTAGKLIIELTSGFGSVTEAKTFNPIAISSAGEATVNMNSIVKMQAGGTIIGKVSVSGSTKTVDIIGAVGGRSYSYFDVVMLWGF